MVHITTKVCAKCKEEKSKKVLRKRKTNVTHLSADGKCLY